jgi:hypothetical protein
MAIHERSASRLSLCAVRMERSAMTGFGPTLPSPASVGHGSYLGINCRQRRSRTTVEDGRVEMWRGGFRLNISVCRPFRLAVP